MPAKRTMPLLPNVFTRVATRTIVAFLLAGASLACGGPGTAPLGDGSSTTSTNQAAGEPTATFTTAPEPTTTTSADETASTETSAVGPSAPVGFKEGNRAPDFTLTFSDGQPVSLASLRNQGKPVVLYFFATW